MVTTPRSSHRRRGPPCAARRKAMPHPVAPVLPDAAQGAPDLSERSRMEAQLRESEARYRRIVLTAQVGVWEIGPDDCTTFVNPRMAAMLGYTVPEMLGMPLFAFMDDEWRAIAAPSLARRRAGLAEQHEFQFRCKDGSVLWTILEASPHFDAAGQYLGALAMVADITARKAAQDALQQREAQLEAAERLAHLGHWIWDLATDQITWSAEHWRIFGREPQDGPIAAAVALAQIHPADRPLIDRAVARAVRDGVPFDLEVRILRSDGSTVVIQSQGTPQLDATGAPVRLLGTAHDITERKAADRYRLDAEATQLAAAAQLRQAFEETVSVLANALEFRDPYTAGHQRRVADLAVAISRRLGLSDDQIEGIHFGALIHDVGKNDVPSEILNRPG